MNKAIDAFRTISEAADELDLPQHVLRFWETRFTQIKPMKRGGGRRYYRPDDLDLLRGIRHLLYNEGYTIKGVKRILKEHGIHVVIAVGQGVETNEALAQSAPALQPSGARQEPELQKPTSYIEPSFSNAPVDKDHHPDDILYDDNAEEEKKERGLISRIMHSTSGKSSGHLNRQDIEHLQAVLCEMLECKRILDRSRH